MGTGAILGQPARYNASIGMLNDGDALALQVNQSGTTLTSTSLPIGSGNFHKNTKNGMLARYNTNLLTLQDGDSCALQVDINGALIIAS